MSNYLELKAQQEEVTRQMQAARAEELADLKQRIKDLGATPEELGIAPAKARATRVVKSRGPRKTQAADKQQGAPVPAPAGGTSPTIPPTTPPAALQI